MNNLSQEYILSIAVVLGALAKGFGFEIENSVIESLVLGVVGVYLAFRRYQKGDINALGQRV